MIGDHLPVGDELGVDFVFEGERGFVGHEGEEDGLIDDEDAGIDGVHAGLGFLVVGGDEAVLADLDVVLDDCLGIIVDGYHDREIALLVGFDEIRVVY